jgi:tetratricopeptide (TPR) repeat protein
MLVAQDVQTQLNAALGALALGNWREAHEKLERLPPERQTTPEVLLLRCRAYAKAGQWGEVERIASRAVATFPDKSSFCTQWAWAVYRQGKTVEALEILSQAAERFPKSVALAYAAACLNGALRRVAEAKSWLGLAIECASNPNKVKLRSLVQPELQCLWNEDRQHGSGFGEVR